MLADIVGFIITEPSGGGGKVITALLIIALIISVSKWLVYRMSLIGVLMYYAERGQELPDQSTIDKYQAKAARKLLGIEKP